MGLVVKSAIATAGLAAVVSAAYAADMPRSRPIDLPPPTYVRPPTTSMFTGWYLRGDLGYRWGKVSGSQAASGFASPGSESLGQSFAGGLGIGLKTDWLRTDATIDFGSPMKYEATTVTANDTTAKVSAITALFNGYLDLGTWYNATPYIGAAVLRRRFAQSVEFRLGGDGGRCLQDRAQHAVRRRLSLPRARRRFDRERCLRADDAQ